MHGAMIVLALSAVQLLDSFNVIAIVWDCILVAHIHRHAVKVIQKMERYFDTFGYAVSPFGYISIRSNRQPCARFNTSFNKEISNAIRNSHYELFATKSLSPRIS